MPFAYNPMPAPYLERANPVGNALAAYGGVQDIQTQQMKNQLLQEGLQERRDVRNVMAEEGPLESKWEKVFAISPEAGERMARAIHYMKPDEKARYAKIGDWMEKTVPLLEKPEQVALWRNDLGRVAPEIAAFIPTVDELSKPGEMEKFRYKMLNWTKAGQEQLKQYGIRGTKEHEYALKGGIQGMKDEAAMARTKVTAGSRERAASMRAKGGYAPQLVENEEGEMGWALPGTDQIVSLPGKFRKAKAEGRLDLNKAAMSQALKELQNDSDFITYPESPASEKKLTAAYDRQRRLLGGRGGGRTSTGGGRVEAIRQKLMQVPPERRQEALNRIRQNDPDVYEMLVGK